MDIIEILRSITEIVRTQNAEPQINLFSKVGLDHDTIRWGCVTILGYLSNQSISPKSNPMKLEQSKEADLACIKLIQAANFLSSIVEIEGNLLRLSHKLTRAEIDNMFEWLREYNRPYTFIDPRAK